MTDGKLTSYMPSKSGIITFAVIVMLFYFAYQFLTGEKITDHYTIKDMGGGQGIRYSGGYAGAELPTHDEAIDPIMHYVESRVGTTNPRQPEVLQKGKKFDWYKFIDRDTYRQSPPFLQRRTYP